MKTETRIKILAKCYMKSKKVQSDYINNMAIEIADNLRKLEDSNPDAYFKVVDHLTEIGYYANR